MQNESTSLIIMENAGRDIMPSQLFGNECFRWKLRWIELIDSLTFQSEGEIDLDCTNWFCVGPNHSRNKSIRKKKISTPKINLLVKQLRCKRAVHMHARMFLQIKVSTKLLIERRFRLIFFLFGYCLISSVWCQACAFTKSNGNNLFDAFFFFIRLDHSCFNTAHLVLSQNRKLWIEVVEIPFNCIYKE